MPDYRAILRASGVNTASLTAGQLSAVINAMHAAYSAGHVSGYSAAISAPHYPHGIRN